MDVLSPIAKEARDASCPWMRFLPYSNQRVGAEEEVAVILCHALADVRSLLVDVRVLVFRIVGIESIPYSNKGRVNDGHLARILVVRYGGIGVLWLRQRTATYLINCDINNQPSHH